MDRSPNAVCSVCDKAIYRRPSQLKWSKVFCSRECSGASQQKLRTCPVCEASFTGQKKHCSRSCSNRSRTGIKYDGTRAYDRFTTRNQLKIALAADRGGVCERCSWPNFGSLQVHHIVERCQGGTDAPDNLELLCANCHTAIHYGTKTYEEFLKENGL